MSSKAPTPFGASASKPASSGGSSAFPPMSTKAPTPFGAPATAKPSTSSGSSAFPPMATKAPTPFGAAAGAKRASSGSSAFPPMSTKSPTPFGASASKPASSAGSSAFPPVSAKAPTSFGAPATAKRANSGSSSAFPPMSAKTPTPFGASASKPASSSGSSTFPPMSAKAPTPFGASASKPVGSGSSAFPPMSAKAPTPFGAPATASSGSSGAFPPMAAKAPTPFGASASKPASSGSSAFPPMSAKAPTPFGAPASSGSSSAFPPMSAKAPTPFGASASKPASSGSSAFPPMSNKAPTPFGAAVGTGDASRKGKLARSAEGETKTSVQSSSLPGMGHMSVTPQKQGISAIGSPPARSPPTPVFSPPTKSPPASASRSSTRLALPQNISDCEQQLFALTENLNQTLARIAHYRPDAKDSLHDHLENLVADIQKMQTLCSDCSGLLAENGRKSAFLLSRKADLSRQVAEARHLVDASMSTQQTAEGTGALLASQPLDRDSEMQRRALATKSVEVQKLLNIVKNRLVLLTKICATDPDAARNDLLQTLVNSFSRIKLFSTETKRLAEKVGELSEKIPSRPSQAAPAAKRHRSRKPPKIEPLSVRGSASSASRPRQVQPSNDDSRSKKAERWAAVEASLQGFQSQIVTKKSLKQFPAVKAKPAKQQKTPNRKPTQSFLLPPSTTPALPLATLAPANTPQLLLSQPPTMATRSAWDRVSELDKAKNVSLQLPEGLNEVTFAGESRKALAGFGTTPEKVKESSDVIRRGVSPRPPSRPKQSPPANERKKSASDAFPPLSSKAPTNPFSTKTPSADSDAAAKVPTIAKLPGDQSLKGPAMASMSIKDALTTAPKRLASGGKDRGPFDSASKSPFGSMGGLGTSLFGEKVNPSSSEPSAGPGGSTPDYKGLLTEFYQKHNPEKVKDVDKYLAKFSDKIPELFAKLANKYKVENPLKSAQLPAASHAAASPFPMTSASTGAPPPPPSGSEPNQMKSPFDSSKPPAALSPFGSTPAKGPQSLFGNAASSTPAFGSSTPTPAPAFGSSTPAPAGFGSPAPAFGSSSATATPAFGANAPAPAFGSPSPFGAPPATPAFGNAPAGPTMQSTPAGGSQQLFGGRPPRDVLVQFYQKIGKADQIQKIDGILQKYQGQEEKLFSNLQHKYGDNWTMFVKQSSPAPAFGTPAGGGFGSPSPGGFGQASALGGARPSPFGGGGFGQPSALGQSSGMPGGMGMSGGGGGTFGNSSSGFGGASFGALAQNASPSPFGAPPAAAAPGGFGGSAAGGGFGSSPPFGSATPFGAPRR
ncbi:Nucleoporin 153kDa [Seminavis robusta]|uniref:Nucleoporin 153kDa n=1 Tax=Seminavis robusta TaxID=568900 RepID=A0A9N8H4V6_9STRA|nr:Nucleoporin 153kDa [Seminavis robusta]|eukprot:Sro59_g034130.1 Nucleoporin 153kDa (1294) ;mRNA; r:51554-55513